MLTSTKIVGRAKKYKSFMEQHACYHDETLDLVFRYKSMAGEVRVHHRKGHIHLLAAGEPHGDVWLRGDDIDAVIGMLRQAKKTWLAAYRKTERVLAKRKADQKKGKARR